MKRPRARKPSAKQQISELEAKHKLDMQKIVDLEAKHKREIEELKQRIDALALLPRNLTPIPSPPYRDESWRDNTLVPRGHSDYDSMYSDFGPK